MTIFEQLKEVELSIQELSSICSRLNAIFGQKLPEIFVDKDEPRKKITIRRVVSKIKESGATNKKADRIRIYLKKGWSAREIQQKLKGIGVSTHDVYLLKSKDKKNGITYGENEREPEKISNRTLTKEYFDEVKRLQMNGTTSKETAESYQIDLGEVNIAFRSSSYMDYIKNHSQESDEEINETSDETE